MQNQGCCLASSVHGTQDPARGTEWGQSTRVMGNMKERGQPHAREHHTPARPWLPWCQRTRSSARTRTVLGLWTPGGAPESTLLSLPASALLPGAAACHSRNPTGSESDRLPALPPTSGVTLPPRAPPLLHLQDKDTTAPVSMSHVHVSILTQIHQKQPHCVDGCNHSGKRSGSVLES